jgi:hypothetical protein
MGWWVNATLQLPYSEERDLVPKYREVALVPEPGWTREENLAFIGIRSLDRPAPSESLYQLSYPGPPLMYGTLKNIFLVFRNQYGNHLHSHTHTHTHTHTHIYIHTRWFRYDRDKL